MPLRDEIFARSGSSSAPTVHDAAVGPSPRSCLVPPTNF